MPPPFEEPKAGQKSKRPKQAGERRQETTEQTSTKQRGLLLQQTSTEQGGLLDIKPQQTKEDYFLSNLNRVKRNISHQTSTEQRGLLHVKPKQSKEDRFTSNLNELIPPTSNQQDIIGRFSKL